VSENSISKTVVGDSDGAPASPIERMEVLANGEKQHRTNRQEREGLPKDAEKNSDPSLPRG
jgi:hypothetical protein